ncbi:unnamed protein product [Effrenium voratum]|nr:unnamed protein product [Effrenium voratum]
MHIDIDNKLHGLPQLAQIHRAAQLFAISHCSAMAHRPWMYFCLVIFAVLADWCRFPVVLRGLGSFGPAACGAHPTAGAGAAPAKPQAAFAKERRKWLYSASNHHKPCEECWVSISGLGCDLC